MTGIFRQFMIAAQFLTAIPLPGDYVREEKDLSRSMMFYPVVGLAIGFITLISYRAASPLFPSAVSLAIAYVIAILLTGGLHIDGFADTCDGFYAGKDKAGILAVMKDSHIGTMAVIGVFCLLLLKFSLMFSLLLKDNLTAAFLVAPAVGRGTMTLAAGLYPYARAEGTAKPFIENTGHSEMAVSSILILSIAFAAAGVAGICVSFGTFTVAFMFLQWVKGKIGGITGDILGSVNEMSELSALALLNVALPVLKTRWIP